jgi:hypothetical protein
MTGLWVLTGAALAVAVAAWLNARRAARRAAQLSEMYWELKYQYLELRKQLEGPPAAAGSRPAQDPSPPSESFVPLTSLRR